MGSWLGSVAGRLGGCIFLTIGWCGGHYADSWSVWTVGMWGGSVSTVVRWDCVDSWWWVSVWTLRVVGRHQCVVIWWV